MKTKYDVYWSGLDNGHEGMWKGPIWCQTFKILAENNGANFQDPESPIYKSLEKALPSVAWKSKDSKSATGFRLFFRDAREPWSSTGVINFSELTKTISTTELGKRLARGEISPAEVFIRAMEAHQEGGEKPFSVLAGAFLQQGGQDGLTFDQLAVGVMRNYRPNRDNLNDSLKNVSEKKLEGTPLRRFKHILEMLEDVGAISSKDDEVYVAWNSEILERIAGGIVNSPKINMPALNTLIDEFQGDCKKFNLSLTRGIALRLAASLCAKRFLILTGLAGSGKTKLAQAFARWLVLTNSEGDVFIPGAEIASQINKRLEKCYTVLPVGADWTGNENIVGYPDGLHVDKYVAKPALELILHAEQHKLIPHFLILDEMNLSHVERYFADILSTIESDENLELYPGDMERRETWRQASATKAIPPKLKQLPENLFIIGTVNVDETTHMFSPKVLDRANVIEFRMDSDELKGFLVNPSRPDLAMLDGKGASFGEAFVKAAKKPVSIPSEVKAAYDAEILLFFETLQAHGTEFGYRTAYDTARFIHFYKLLGNHSSGDTNWFSGAFDCVIFQKLLPKLHGSRAKLGPVLKKLWFLCVSNMAVRGDDALKAAEESKAEPNKGALAGAYYPMSAEKILRMWRLLNENGFTSFAEA